MPEPKKAWSSQAASARLDEEASAYLERALAWLEENEAEWMAHRVSQGLTKHGVAFDSAMQGMMNAAVAADVPAMDGVTAVAHVVAKIIWQQPEPEAAWRGFAQMVRTVFAEISTQPRSM